VSRDTPRRILIADPDPQFAGRLSALLSAEGCEVEAVEGVTDAAARLRDVDFHCVVVDEDLPEMKGHDAVPVLRTISPDVPIIMTAGRNSLEIERCVRRRDVFFYHVKSFDLRELLTAVRNALGRAEKEDAPRGGKRRRQGHSDLRQPRTGARMRKKPLR